MSKVIKWGILGPGGIARHFVEGIPYVQHAEVAAVGSRSLEKAKDFAEKYGIPRFYGSYQELLADPELDIIYVATPHPSHKEYALDCLKAGKAVLVEKPITMNTVEAEELVAYARQAKLFLMEAMWTRFLPVMAQVRSWLAEGRIGDIRMVKADFGFRIGWDPENRLLNPELGGGALLDVGIYTVSLASMIFGCQPEQIRSLAHIGETGVDEQYSLLLGYPGGQTAVLNGAVRTGMPNDAWILGTEGHIHIPEFFMAEFATLTVSSQEPVVYAPDLKGPGYQYEAAEAVRCLLEGKLESDGMPLDETLGILRILDQVRGQWGLKYKGE